jgi:hypothetical protein
LYATPNRSRSSAEPVRVFKFLPIGGKEDIRDLQSLPGNIACNDQHAEHRLPLRHRQEIDLFLAGQSGRDPFRYVVEAHLLARFQVRALPLTQEDGTESSVPSARPAEK